MGFGYRLYPSYNLLLEVVWADAHWHARAMQRLLVDGQRNLSFVDCLSFEIIEAKEIRFAFAFDRHFKEQGISAVP